MVVTKKILPRFKYDKSKVEEYQLALIVRADGLVNLLQQCMGAIVKFTFGNKPLGGSCKERHYYKPWFDVDYRTTKRELKLWLKANFDSHDVKHQENKLKNLLKNKRSFWETTKLQHMCAFAKVDVFLFWKKYRPRALVVDKINVITLFESFCELVGQSSPPIRLQIDHSARVMVPPPSHTLNTNITLVELL